MKIRVIVVPETEDFTHYVSHENVVGINTKLGTPDLIGRNAKYLAPYWITKNFRGVNRIYHILNALKDKNGNTCIELGNSFVTNKPWDNMGQLVRFEYHDLSEFNFEEIQNGILKLTANTQ